MAPNKKPRKKTSGTQRKKNNRSNQKAIKESGAVQDDIILVITLAFAILLFLSNFNLAGKVGNALSSFFFGMVGTLAYPMPFIIFFTTAFHLSNIGNKRAGRKIMSFSIFLTALAALLELAINSYHSSTLIFQYYTDSVSRKNGGGIIGGILVMLFGKLFDEVGTYIILLTIMLICIIIISGKAIVTLIAKKSKYSITERREYQKLRKEQTLTEAADDNKSKRRPPKTYLLDSPSVVQGNKKKPSKITAEDDIAGTADISGKTRRDKKCRNEQPSENDDLFHLNIQGIPEQNTSEKIPDSMYQQEAIPLYEQELRMKFGNSSTANVKLPEPESEPEPEPAAEQYVSDHITPVEQLEPDSPKVSAGPKECTTSVEPLDITQTPQQKEYIYPPVRLLTSLKTKTKKNPEKQLKETAMKLQNTLDSFGVHVTITNVSCGPAVTRYELQPEQGVKVSRITALSDDIKLNLAAADIRIEAPIPGKAAVGIEVPNKENSMVAFREMIESRDFNEHPSDLAFAVGKDIGGQTMITDIAKMPHLLIAGATGSGKSVCINTLIMSILYKAKPSDVRMIMVDPKVVELSVYNGIPHLLIPVVTDPKKASAALNWAVMEMTERYKKFADTGVRDLKGYNEKVASVVDLADENYQKLPQIIIIIDELADLMMVAPGEVEDAICRLAQMARAAGLHLIIATQRPSVNVITGLIKANIPSRIAFAVSSAIDSRTILDGSGAEKLLGKGDMLFFPSGYPKPVRIQGAFISDKEVSSVVEFLKANNSEANYNDDIHDKINNAQVGEKASTSGENRDEYFMEAGKFIIEKDKASIGMLQRVYKIGFNRAARIMDQLSEAGVVGPEEGTKPRKVLMSQEEFEQYMEEH